MTKPTIRETFLLAKCVHVNGDTGYTNGLYIYPGNYKDSGGLRTPLMGKSLKDLAEQCYKRGFDITNPNSALKSWSRVPESFEMDSEIFVVGPTDVDELAEFTGHYINAKEKQTWADRAKARTQ